MVGKNVFVNFAAIRFILHLITIRLYAEGLSPHCPSSEGLICFRAQRERRVLWGNAAPLLGTIAIKVKELKGI